MIETMAPQLTSQRPLCDLIAELTRAGLNPTTVENMPHWKAVEIADLLGPGGAAGRSGDLE
jgi:hypothetical protein